MTPLVALASASAGAGAGASASAASLTGNRAGSSSSSTAVGKPDPAGALDLASLPATDAVLSCPGCFTVVCRLCQQHKWIPGHFRAADAENVLVKWQQRVKPPPAADAATATSTAVASAPVLVLHPIACSVCRTDLGTYEPLECGSRGGLHGRGFLGRRDGRADVHDLYASGSGEHGTDMSDDHDDDDGLDGIYHFTHVIDAEG